MDTANATQHESLMTMAVNANKDTVNIADVKSGLQSDAFCVVCNSTLIAKKGEIKAHHFAHTNGTECKYWRETFIHLAVKRYFTETKEILLPGYFIGRELIQSQFVFKFAECIVENRLGSIVPDICLVADNGAKLIVEVAVTHFCDEVKIQKIKELNISCIEIDFSKFRHYDCVKDSDIKKHIEGLSAVWLFNKKITPIYDKLIDARNRLSTINVELGELNKTINEWYIRGRGSYEIEWTKSVRVLPDNDLNRWDASICPVGNNNTCAACGYNSRVDKGGEYWYVACAYSEDDDYFKFMQEARNGMRLLADKKTAILKSIQELVAEASGYSEQIRNLKLKTADVISNLKFIN